MVSADGGLMQRCRAEILALANKSYFNFGGQGTLPTAALSAIVLSYRFVQTRGPFSTQMVHWIYDELQETRQMLAAEFSGDSDCYAMTQSATEGCNIVLWGTEWQPGDRLLITDAEHPGVVAAAQTMVHRGDIELVSLPVAGRDDALILEDLEQLLRQPIKLMMISHILWNTGAVLPIKEMTELCHRQGTKVLVDGAQSAGAIPLDLIDLGVDYYAMTGHKWLCGPEGLGTLYISTPELESLRPTFVGWRSNLLETEPRPNASRFEVATMPFPLLAGLRAAIQFHKRWGTAAQRFEMILQNAELLQARLESSGKAKCVSQSGPKSGLVSFALPGQDHAKVLARLEHNNIFARTIANPDTIRASVHYFTDASEIERLVSIATA